ncbi:MAG: hypothetical protein LBV74_20915 [Tannerella sp.]|jgi:hypothetical protein|nr:hypothetical protein [Tannerella sp.]
MNYIKSYGRIVTDNAILNGKVLFEPDGRTYTMHEFLSVLYGYLGTDYRKFYKMDALSKLGFLASEMVLAGIDRETPKEETGIAFFNTSASLEADKKYQQTIQHKEDFFPSPADFVYTLPNIVTGEIAIRNKIYGETSFYVINRFLSDIICKTVNNMITFGGMKRVLAGWTEVDLFTGTLSCLMMLCEVGDVSGVGTSAGQTAIEAVETNDLMMPLTDEVLDKLYT